MSQKVPLRGQCGIEIGGVVVYGDPFHDRVTGRAEENVSVVIGVNDLIRGDLEEFEVSETIKANSGDVESVAKTAYPSDPAELLPKIVGVLSNTEVDKRDELEKAKKDRITKSTRSRVRAGILVGGTTAALGTNAVYSFIEGRDGWGVGLSLATVVGGILTAFCRDVREGDVFDLGEDQKIARANNRVGLLKIMQTSVQKNLVKDTKNTV